jgi:hypothetical protein
MYRTLVDLLEELEKNPLPPKQKHAVMGITPKQHAEIVKQHHDTIVEEVKTLTSNNKKTNYKIWSSVERFKRVYKISAHPGLGILICIPRVRSGTLGEYLSEVMDKNKEVYFTGPAELQTIEDFQSAELRKLTPEKIERIQAAQNKHMRSISDINALNPKTYPGFKPLKQNLKRTMKFADPKAKAYSFALVNMPLLEAEVAIRKDTYKPIFSKQTYSAWLGEQPILMHMGNGLEALATTRQDEPLRFVKKDIEESHLALTQELLGLRKYDVITPTGYRLFGAQERKAKEIFWRARNGLEILPAPDEPLGYIQRRPRGVRDNGEPTAFDSREQKYLRRQRPERIEPGELLGSGGSYLAFYFGNKVFVEADQDDRATYIFTKNGFEKLHNLPRQQLIMEKPKGFIGRIFHYEDDRARWREEMRKYLPKKWH